MACLASLKLLDVSGNALSELPEELCQLQRLEKLQVCACIMSVPRSVPCNVLAVHCNVMYQLQRLEKLQVCVRVLNTVRYHAVPCQVSYHVQCHALVLYHQPPPSGCPARSLTCFCLA
jgi:hypothetical protein